MKCLVVLSHLMSKDCMLGVESVARCELAIKKFNTEDYNFIITIGWDYRADCTTSISDVVKKFILENSHISESSILSLASSRDTVGDAYYCLKYLFNTPVDELHVVTSDYHVNRVELIFNKIFNQRLIIKVFGAKTAANNDSSVLMHERQSIDAFLNTFADSDLSSVQSISNTLATKHPFYNGEIYPKIENNQTG